jgi:predicted secreted hydrolase
MSYPANNGLGVINGFGYEWWYYTLNMKTENDNLSMVLILGREAVYECYSLEDNIAIGMIDIKYEVNEDKNIHKTIAVPYNFTESEYLDLRVYVSHNQYLVMKKYDDYMIITYDDIYLKVFDGRGIVPQGDDGLSISGPYPCDTAFAWSYPRLAVIGIINSDSVSGFGYGEHVAGTRKLEKVIYSGWHCHYLHHKTKLYDVHLCQSNRYDKKTDIYGRGFIMNERDEIIKLDYRNMEFISSNPVLPPLNNYPMDWLIKLNYNDSNKIVKDELQFDSTFTNQFRNMFGWTYFAGLSESKDYIGTNDLDGY